MTIKSIAIAALCLPLAACNLGMGDPTNSSFTTPSSSGTISKASGGRSGALESGVTGNIVAYQVGSVKEDGLQGFAGIAPGASVTAAPASGSATYSGEFELGLVTFIMQQGTSVSGQTTADRGAIALTANFDTGRLTGGGTGLNGGVTNIILRENPLSVDGTFTGQTLTGTVTYNGITGPLRGVIGGNEVIGAFHAHTNNSLHAGGFIAN